MYRRRRQFKHYLHCIKHSIIPYILIVGGTILIISLLPVWIWIVVIGLLLIGCGIYILNSWR